jgi:hypothetical protein
MLPRIVTFDQMQSWCDPTPITGPKHTTVRTTMANATPSGAHRVRASSETKDIHQKRVDQPKSLSLHNQHKIPRTELISARSMTAIVKWRQKATFSEVCPGQHVGHVFDVTHDTPAGKPQQCLFCAASPPQGNCSMRLSSEASNPAGV